MYLSQFQMIRPASEISQEETLDWLVKAHAKAESHREGFVDGEFQTALKEKLWRVGCKPDRIQKRGHVLKDYLHRDWDKMEIHRLNETPAGENLSVRSQVYDREVNRIFEPYCPQTAAPPDDLIHVSCTGYVAPSGAQRIVSKRNWGEKTTVTHAYHMGCYGSLPALRMASGFLHSRQEKQRADIVHTELCTLHMNPSLHQTDQLVTQSLFADGFMKYSADR